MDTNSTWIVAARVEDKDSFFADAPITAGMLRQMVAAYDSDFRMAPVIASFNPRSGDPIGPAHLSGQYASPLGFIRQLDFDGLNLWARVEELVDGEGDPLVTKAVVAGALQRSIGWWDKTPELPGEPPYLRHLALLTGENPGTPNLPPLDEYYAVATRDAVTGRMIAEAPYFTRSMMDTLPQPAREPERAQQEDTMDETTRAEIHAAVQRALTEALAPALQAALAPVAERITGVESGLTETRAATLEQTASIRSQALNSRLDELVRAGRVSPAERDSESEILTLLSPEKADQRLHVLGSRSVRVGRGNTPFSTLIPIEGGESLNLRRYTMPGSEDGQNINQESLEILRAAKQQSGGDPKRFEQIAMQLAGEAEV